MWEEDKEKETPDEQTYSPSKRNFFKIMGIVAIGALAVGSLNGVIQYLIPSEAPSMSAFPTLTLMNSSGKTIHTADIIVNAPQIVLFKYPLSDEPNFLLRLGDTSNKDVEIKPTTVTIPLTGKTFASPGGVGPYKSIVAASAICQHLGCQPPNLVYHLPTDSSFPGKIHCDCHGSTYDPFNGFSVVTTPTKEPLPNIILKYDATQDSYQVNGMVGPTVYGHTNDLSEGSPLPSTTSTSTYTVSG
ncbi:MAG: Rieske 2Fe-2S domain-containing protein [Thermoplasmataceae archaeon]